MLENDLPLARGNDTETTVSFTDALRNYRRNVNWWAVAASFALPNFDSSPLWIAKKTGVKVEEVAEALDGLRLLGVIKKGPNGLEPATDSFVLPQSQLNTADIIDEHAVASLQILNELRPDSKAVFRTEAFASNKEIIQKMYRKIDTAIEEAFQESKNCSKDGIYLTSLTSLNRRPKVRGGDQ